MQIGEVAGRTGLSLRTIRFYDEVGLAPPSMRSEGGFRLYTEPDVARLELIMRMKPLGFSLDEMRELLESLDAVDAPGPRDGRLVERLERFHDAAQERVAQLRRQLATAQTFADTIAEHRRRVAPGDPVRSG